MTNVPVTPLYLSPTQQVNHALPIIEAAMPRAYTSYGHGLVSIVDLLARDAVRKNFLKAVSPAIDFGESRVPCHLPR